MMLSLAEEVLLLALLERKETLHVPSSPCLSYALAGATILELINSGHASIADDRLVLLSKEVGIENAQMKIAIEKIERVDKLKKVNHWVYLFGARGNRITKMILQSLIEKKILLEEGKNYVWGPVDREGYQEISKTKYLLKHYLRNAVFCDEVLEKHAAAVLRLMEACEMLDHVFTKDEIILARKKIKRLSNEANWDSEFSNALTVTVVAVDYAIAAAIST